MEDSSQLTPQMIANFFREMNPAEKEGNALNRARFFISIKDFVAAQDILIKIVDSNPNEVAAKLLVICENGLKLEKKNQEKKNQEEKNEEEKNEEEKR